MASLETIKDILNDLAKFYGRKQSPAQRLFYEASTDDLDDDLLCKAVMSLKRTEPPARFPTVETIRKYYLTEKDRLWQRQKNNSPRMPALTDLPLSGVVAKAEYEKTRPVFAGIGKMPKDQWLKLAVANGVMNVVEANQMRELWRQMGADPKAWRRSDLFEPPELREPGGDDD